MLLILIDLYDKIMNKRKKKLRALNKPLFDKAVDEWVIWYNNVWAGKHQDNKYPEIPEGYDPREVFYAGMERTKK